MLLLLLACARNPSPEPPVNAPHTWQVYAGRELILTVSDTPGPITSTAPPPPGGAVTTHPFLSAAAHDAGYEAQLGAMLQQSTTVDDFLARMRAQGYRVVAQGEN